MASKRKQILAQLKSNMAAISTAGGYNYDVAKATLKFLPWSEVHEFPVLIVIAGDEEAQEATQNPNGAYYRSRFDFSIVGYAQFDTDTQDDGNASDAEENLVEDIKKALAADPLLGGLVEECVWDKVLSWVDHDQNVTIVEVQGHVVFQHLDSEP